MVNPRTVPNCFGAGHFLENGSKPAMFRVQAVAKVTVRDGCGKNVQIKI